MLFTLSSFLGNFEINFMAFFLQKIVMFLDHTKKYMNLWGAHLTGWYGENWAVGNVMKLCLVLDVGPLAWTYFL